MDIITQISTMVSRDKEKVEEIKAFADEHRNLFGGSDSSSKKAALALKAGIRKYAKELGDVKRMLTTLSYLGPGNRGRPLGSKTKKTAAKKPPQKKATAKKPTAAKKSAIKAPSKKPTPKKSMQKKEPHKALLNSNKPAPSPASADLRLELD